MKSLVVGFMLILNCLANENDFSFDDLELRLSSYKELSMTLKTLKDADLVELIDQSEALHAGTGGSSVKLELNGTPIFVKLVPLNEVESQCQSTKNWFNLPIFYQYGVGSAGFNIWREVRGHETSTEWVLSRRKINFPMLYHWRILKRSKPIPPLDQEKLIKKVRYWENTSSIGERLKSNHFSSVNVVLFLEYIPENLNDWLGRQSNIGTKNLDEAIKLVERDLIPTVQFMNDQDMLHFDLHFWNILTDGKCLYFSDFGLANRGAFDHSDEERAFFHNHLNYDRCYAVTHLTYWLISHLFGENQAKNILSIYASGKTPESMPEAMTPYQDSVIRRYAPLTEIMDKFVQALIHETKRTSYPKEELDKLWLESQKQTT